MYQQYKSVVGTGRGKKKRGAPTRKKLRKVRASNDRKSAQLNDRKREQQKRSSTNTADIEKITGIGRGNGR